MSTTEEKFGVFEMPYIIVNRAHMKKVTENPQVQKLLFQRSAGKRNQSPRSLGERIPPHHEQRPAYRQA